MLPVFTVATHYQRGLGQFVTSCRRQGVDPVILGYGQRWRGFGWRLRLLRETLETFSGPVLFHDGYDAILTTTAADVWSRYRAFRHPLVFGAEVFCWPNTERAAEFPESPTPFRFPNAGGFIGEAEYVCELLDRHGGALLPDTADDQAFWQRLLLADPQVFALDYRQSIFGLMCRAEAAFRPDPDGIRCEWTGSYPAILHGNGQTEMSEVRRWAKLQ